MFQDRGKTLIEKRDVKNYMDQQYSFSKDDDDKVVVVVVLVYVHA